MSQSVIICISAYEKILTDVTPGGTSTKTIVHVNDASTPMEFRPLRTLIYILKFGFIGVYTISLIFALKHRLWIHIRIDAVLMSIHNIFRF